MDNLLDQTSRFVQLMITNAQQACIREVGVITQMITGQQLADTVHAVLPSMQVTLNDEKYAITSFASWQKIIALDWTARKKYMADTFDCDNFSDAFRAHVSEIYNLNSAGSFHCIVQADNGTVNKTGHRAVLIVALDGYNQLALYAYESENEGISKVVLGQGIRIPVFSTFWNYTPLDAAFN